MRAEQRVPGGVPLARAEQPALWQLVDGVADGLDIRPPDELHLVQGVGIDEVERSRALGLVPGPRRMRLGLGALQALRVDELRALVALELGRRAPHRWTAPLIHRVGGYLQRLSANAGNQTVLGWLTGSARSRFDSLTLRARQRQDAGAEARAIEIAGRAAYAAARRRSVKAERAFAWYRERYVVPLHARGDYPALLYAGFRAVLAHPTPEWHADPKLAAVTPLSPSNPGLHQEPPPDPRPSRALLRGAESLDRALSRRAAPPPTAAHLGFALEWHELAMGPYAQGYLEDAVDVLDLASHVDGRGRPGHLRTLLEVLETDGIIDLARAAAGDLSDLDEDRRVSLQEEALKTRLSTTLGAALVAQGVAQWRVGWTGTPQVVVDGDRVIDLRDNVEFAVDGGGIDVLREWLEREGLDLDWPPSGTELTVQAGGGLAFSDLINDVRYAGRRFDLLVGPEVLALVRARLTPAEAVAAALWTLLPAGRRLQAGSPLQARLQMMLWSRLQRMGEHTLSQRLADDPRGRLIRASDITRGRLRQRRSRWRLELWLIDDSRVQIDGLAPAPPHRQVVAALWPPLGDALEVR
jgi:hypothetical protein